MLLRILVIKLLLYIDDNASASNKHYSDKLNIYQNGKMGQTQGTPVNTFELVKELISNYPSQFNHTEVEKRAKQLAQYAKDIWTAKIAIIKLVYLIFIKYLVTTDVLNLIRLYYL